MLPGLRLATRLPLIPIVHISKKVLISEQRQVQRIKPTIIVSGNFNLQSYINRIPVLKRDQLVFCRAGNKCWFKP